VLSAITPTAAHSIPAGRLLEATAFGLDLLILDAPTLFVRPGNPYTGPDGADWPDNPLRFAALCAAAADVAQGALPGWMPDILHCHDWQAGLAPAYLHHRGAPHPPTVMTVHNLAFAGRAPASQLAALNLPPAAFAIEGVEFHGDISFLKAGLHYADRITTVSPTYAAEILTPEFGMGFDGLLRARAGLVHGILNGIDTAAWNPATDPLIPSRYSTPAGRTPNKSALQARFGLTPDPAAPLFGVVSRLTWQKGLDLLIAALDTLLAEGAQLALLGTGEPGMESAFRAAAAAHPGRVAAIIGYDESLAHLIQAGADALLVPSRFEPCGLTQLCALRYGAIPVVARTGGLADTVIDASPMALAAGAATGVTFARPDADALRGALRRSIALYRQPAIWQAMQAAGLRTDVSWTHPAAAYAALYRDLMGGA
jgi:starch synthase